jgi:phage gp45-like
VFDREGRAVVSDQEGQAVVFNREGRAVVFNREGQAVVVLCQTARETGALFMSRRKTSRFSAGIRAVTR